MRVPEDKDSGWYEYLVGPDVARVEPSLQKRFPEAIFLPKEGQLDNRQLLSALTEKLEKTCAAVHFNAPVSGIEPHTIVVDGQRFRFDIVIDCRGMGAGKSCR